MSGPAASPATGDDLLLDPGVLAAGTLVEFHGFSAVERHGGSAVLPWRGAWREAAARGVDARPQPPPGPLAQIAVRLTKGKAGVLADLSAAAGRLAPGGRLVVVGANDLGIASWADRLAGVWGVPQVAAHRARSRALVWTGPLAPLPVPEPGRVPALPADLDPGTPDLAVPAGVFSPDGLDAGTATLLRFRHGEPPVASVADLGCGAGHLGLHEARRGARAWLMDADHRAVTAAAANAEALGLRVDTAWADEADPWPTGVDLVLANPPAHRGQTVDLGPGTALLAKGLEILAPGGRLLAVANRQLPYERALGRFGALTIHDRGPFKILELRRG